MVGRWGQLGKGPRGLSIVAEFGGCGGVRSRGRPRGVWGEVRLN